MLRFYLSTQIALFRLNVSIHPFTYCWYWAVCYVVLCSAVCYVLLHVGLVVWNTEIKKNSQVHVQYTIECCTSDRDEISHCHLFSLAHTHTHKQWKSMCNERLQAVFLFWSRERAHTLHRFIQFICIQTKKNSQCKSNFAIPDLFAVSIYRFIFSPVALLSSAFDWNLKLFPNIIRSVSLWVISRPKP